jgi:glucosamine--fructose-6-phosphate aminotransferase (isomerizing)
MRSAASGLAFAQAIAKCRLDENRSRTADMVLTWSYIGATRKIPLSSQMEIEALSAASAVAAQRTTADEQITALARRLTHDQPKLALTVARGSSDHAANYFAYLAMLRLGVPVVSLPMSLVTLHRAPLAVDGQLAVALSQSGESPDLVETMTALREAGATTAAFVNRTESPLAKHCEWVVPLSAGTERSVAATKSYIAALAAIARLVARWQAHSGLLQAIDTLPDRLDEAAHVDGMHLLDALVSAERAMVVGRGLGFTVALEAALKLKEVCTIQAEAFSSAEVRHGPMALIDEGYPLIVFALRGPEQAGIIEFAREMRGRGARVTLAAPDDIPEADVTLAVADDEVLDPILAILSFYLVVAKLAEARGLDADAPRHLSKVTRTH